MRVDDPVLVAQGGEELLPVRGLGECPTTTRQGELALAIELLEPRQVQPPKTPREDPDGQEEVGSTWHPPRAISREPASGQDTMEMGMMVELLAPGVQHGEAADLGSEMLRVSSNVLKGLRDGAKEQPIEQARVLECQRPEVVRERKDHMTVGGLQELLFAGGEPRRLGRTVTFRAAAVAARVVRLLFVPTVVALGDMSAQGRGATQRDGAQGPVLLTRQGRPIAGQKGGAMLAHHIGDFQRRPTHGSRSRLAGNARASKGLSVAWSAGWATWR